MKRILTLLLALTLICCMLASCAATPEQIIEKADAALAEAPYKMTVKMDFQCDNKIVNEIFSAMNLEIPVIIDGDNLSMDMSMTVMEYSTTAKMTVVDKVMYYDIEMMGQSFKMKATMNDEEYQEFLEENNTQMMLTPDNFENLKIEAKDGKQYISCTGINSDGLDELEDAIDGALNSIGGKATIDNVSFVLVLNDGKYESMDMSCTYTVSANNESFTVTLNVGTDFSYDNVASITAPADADKYKDADFGDLFG